MKFIRYFLLIILLSSAAYGALSPPPDNIQVPLKAEETHAMPIVGSSIACPLCLEGVTDPERIRAVELEERWLRETGYKGRTRGSKKVN